MVITVCLGLSRSVIPGELDRGIALETLRRYATRMPMDGIGRSRSESRYACPQPTVCVVTAGNVSGDAACLISRIDPSDSDTRYKGL